MTRDEKIIFREIKKTLLMRLKNNKYTRGLYRIYIGRKADNEYSSGMFKVYSDVDYENLKVVPNGKSRYVVGLDANKVHVALQGAEKAKSPDDKDFVNVVADNIEYSSRFGGRGYAIKLKEYNELPDYITNLNSFSNCIKAKDLLGTRLLKEHCQMYWEFMHDPSTHYVMFDKEFPKIKGKDREIVPVLMVELDTEWVKFWNKDTDSYRKNLEQVSLREVVRDNILVYNYFRYSRADKLKIMRDGTNVHNIHPGYGLCYVESDYKNIIKI